MKMLLTKKFTFEMAHALEGYEGKCANLHGHSYHLEVIIESPKLNNDGMALDFHQIKEIVQENVVNRFDHALVLQENSSLLTNCPSLQNLIKVPFNPTTENLMLYFAQLIEPHLPTDTRLHSIRLAETDTSIAELVM